ncbi:glycosyltransferase [Saccharospirillum alexandrii]|uniref:glycosyltransferase n=1 Tax=Saccharospirillum alexandrii TaxID=2448477 RepID=UPI000FD9C7CE|nr:glycosyltransferase family 2 protein [Saccharospirillum alexandrii]
MILSFVVCTYNRSSFLRLCLTSIFDEIGDSQGYEVIVVDNNSNDSTVDVVNEFEHVTYVYEENQGLSYARNRGIAEAKGKWIAFIDDDAVLRSTWLDAFIHVTKYYNFQCFGGPYFPWYKDGKVPWFPDIYGSNTKWLSYRFSQEISKEVSGGNSVFLRELLEASPMFSTSLGMNGTNVFYGEETYLIRWMRDELGISVGYSPELSIDHYVPLHKQTFSWISKRSVKEGASFVESRPSCFAYTRYFFRVFFQCILFPAILVDLFIKNGFSISFWAVICEFCKPYLKVYGLLGRLFRSS